MFHFFSLQGFMGFQPDCVSTLPSLLSSQFFIIIIILPAILCPDTGRLVKSTSLIVATGSACPGTAKAGLEQLTPNLASSSALSSTISLVLGPGRWPMP